MIDDYFLFKGKPFALLSAGGERGVQ